MVTSFRQYPRCSTSNFLLSRKMRSKFSVTYHKFFYYINFISVLYSNKFLNPYMFYVLWVQFCNIYYCYTYTRKTNNFVLHIKKIARNSASLLRAFYATHLRIPMNISNEYYSRRYIREIGRTLSVLKRIREYSHMQKFTSRIHISGIWF